MATEPNNPAATAGPTLGLGGTVPNAGSKRNADLSKRISVAPPIDELIVAVEQLLARIKSHQDWGGGLPGPGALPLPGYRLLNRLGSGGFGEVWKCEAPGGLLKAVKIIHGDLHSLDPASVQYAEQELKALARVKQVRHPYLLTLDRYDVVDGRLMIVMELADCNLWDRFRECRHLGLSGIPRDELLRYMGETAEVLDLMNDQFQLQHLDIKPQNLFLMHGHIKVADFGQVKDLQGLMAQITGGTTPVYTAPETFDGVVTRYCDQYSLACVYQELLTGVRPFGGSSMSQLLMQHINYPPDLEPSPVTDRAALGRALAKKPGDRWPSCRDFVHALTTPAGTPPLLSAIKSITASITAGTTTAGLGGSPGTVSVPSERNRVLSGDLHRGDYLDTPGDVVARVDRRVAHLRSANGIEVTAEARQRMIDDDTLHRHFPGREVACLRTGEGVVVLAVGSEDVDALLNAITAEQRSLIAIEYP